jgi:hypothetical protein
MSPAILPHEPLHYVESFLMLSALLFLMLVLLFITDRLCRRNPEQRVLLPHEKSITEAVALAQWHIV